MVTDVFGIFENDPKAAQEIGAAAKVETA